MEQSNDYIQQLINKAHYSHQEKVRLLGLLESMHAEDLQRLLQQQLSDNEQRRQPGVELSIKMLEAINERIGIGKEENKAAVVIKGGSGMLVAASIFALLIVCAYFFVNKPGKDDIVKKQVNEKYQRDDVLPGGAKAVLTLSNGSSIVLDSSNSGVLAQQGSTRIFSFNGRVSYARVGSISSEILYNKISTPAGGKFQVTLPDGSNAWLNAASSIRFPTAFAEKERKVEITGEVYFEVEKNRLMPFVVKVDNAEVHVLGTHFNVMSYNDENIIKTTLIEGSIKLIKDNQQVLLKPRQQSQVTRSGNVKVINNIDVSQVIAWKNNFFYFENADLESVMRQLARWYSVEVIYKNKGNGDLFHVDIPTNTKLSEVLKALELAGGVHFRIEGQKVIVV